MAIVGIFLAGLLAAQLVATLHVWFSDFRLAEAIHALLAEGYLAVPSHAVIPPLTAFKAAFGGGVFFTLTIGAGTTLVCFAAAYCGSLFSKRSKGDVFVPATSRNLQEEKLSSRVRRIPNAVLLGGTVWLFLLCNLNKKGFCPFASLYITVIPLVIIPLTLRWVTGVNAHRHLRYFLLSLAPILLLTTIWSTQWDDTLFVRIRDHLLLESKTGRVINDFYYRYTLFPAETFKTLDQKMLKTCYLDNFESPDLVLQIEPILRKRDYLVITDADAADIVIANQGPDLIIKAYGESAGKYKTENFLADPNGVLSEVSKIEDRYAFFRFLVFCSLLVGFPVMLYALLFALFYGLIGTFAKNLHAAAVSAFLCFIIGMALLWPVWRSNIPPQALKHPAQLLRDDRWQYRTAALRQISEKNLALPAGAYGKSQASSHIAERYWLARALSGSRNPEDLPDLRRLLKDPQPNVQCQTFYALGRRGQRSAIPLILQTIQTSDHWYVQWYGYKALRSLGWIQPQSKPRPY